MRNGQKFRKPIRWLKASPAGANFYSLNRTEDPKGSCDRCSSSGPVGEISNLPYRDPPALTRRKILISTPTKSSPTGSEIHHLSHFGSGGSFNKKSPFLGCVCSGPRFHQHNAASFFATKNTTERSSGLRRNLYILYSQRKARQQRRLVPDQARVSGTAAGST